MLQTKNSKKNNNIIIRFLPIPGFFTWQMSVNSSRQQVSFKLPSRMRSDIFVRLSAVKCIKSYSNSIAVLLDQIGLYAVFCHENIKCSFTLSVWCYPQKVRY